MIAWENCVNNMAPLFLSPPLYYYNLAVRDNTKDTGGFSRNFSSTLSTWDARFSPDNYNMVLESLGQHGIFIEQLAPPESGVFLCTSVVRSVCSFTCRDFTWWLQLQIQIWMGLCASVPAEAVLTLPICESQTLCNSLPLSSERMYLSNHLNYYNHCWDGNAWISALTLWNFQGLWKHASLGFGVFAKQKLCSVKCLCPNSWSWIKINKVNWNMAAFHKHSQTLVHADTHAQACDAFLL